MLRARLFFHQVPLSLLKKPVLIENAEAFFLHGRPTYSYHMLCSNTMLCAAGRTCFIIFDTVSPLWQ